MTVEVPPTYATIAARCRRLAARRPDRVCGTEAGRSEEGRPIPMLMLGDPARDLPLAMVTGGMHGEEEVGRAAAMALAEWAAGPGAALLERMTVIILPVCNPDGTIRNIRANGRGTDLCRSFKPGVTPVPAETAIVRAVVREHLPDCFVDIHGLAGGGMGDCQFVYQNLAGNMSLEIGFAVTAAMARAAVKLGFPVAKNRLWGIYDNEAGPPGEWVGTSTNALACVVETTENYYPLRDSVRSALARLKVLLRTGLGVHWNQPYPGFPCDTIAGGPAAALMPFGATYRARRVNRDLLMQAIHQDYCDFGRAPGDTGHAATLTLTLGPKVTAFAEGAVFQAALDPRARLREVRREWPDGSTEQLGPDGRHGYTLWEQDRIPMVRVSVARPPMHGANRVVIAYDAPFQPHVSPPGA